MPVGQNAAMAGEADWGFEQPGELDRVLLVSPHLDDALISCGAFLLAHPGTTVVTMFAASPAAYTDPLNEHDRACGFRPGDDSMAVRRDEDVRALAAVAASPRWLDYCQHSHEPRADPVAVPAGAVDAIRAAIGDIDPTCVLAPLGLLHPDHQALHATALEVRAKDPGRAWFFYSDLPYAYVPGVLGVRLARLYKAGITATPATLPVSHDFDAKWRAFTEYGSQLPAMDAPWRLRERLERGGETYWTLASNE
jgi:LmbE family N-acetylglucosaminyl deacetylase